jgi:hypothetical protein
VITSAARQPTHVAPSATPVRTPGPTLTAARPSLSTEITKLERFVERDRGLTFRRRVAVTVLDRGAFARRVRAEFDRTGVADARAQGRLLTAAGLIPADVDVVAAERDLLGVGVLGFYDPRSKALVVLGGQQVTPLLRVVLAHELTHALDDQYARLDRPDLQARGQDPAWAFLAVVEGSAKRVENDYTARLTPHDRLELQQEMVALGLRQLGVARLPLVLPRLLVSPYDYGEPFVRDVVARAGNRGLTAALRSPPTTSEQVLDAARYARHEAALRVPRPPATGPLLAEGTLGALLTAIVLEGRGQRLGKVAPIRGWGGDRYVIYRTGSATCLRADWRMDTAAALARQAVALRDWAAGDPAVRVSAPRAGVVRATRCAG